MAQYFVKASDAEVLTNFTERNAGGTIAVVDDGGEPAIRLSLLSNNRVFWSFDPIGIGQDFEIVARLRTGAAATDRTGAAVGARISGASASINAVRFADIGFRDGQLGTYVNGNFLQRSRPSELVTDITTYHWIRSRITGDLLQIKLWDGTPEDEPAPWSAEQSVALGFPNGRAGLFVFEVGNHYYTDIGFASNGDIAPTSPISNETVTSDIELIINIQQALTAELDINYDLRESLQADLQSTWNMLNAIHMDVGATWSIIQNLTADLQADWQIVQNVDQVVELPWNIESAIQTAIKDLNASWHIRHAVVASLNTQWQLLAALEIDLQSRWNIAESIITDMQLLFAQRQQVMQSATLTWHQISIAENSITFTWKLGDTVLPPISIIKIRPETRVFRAVIH